MVAEKFVERVVVTQETMAMEERPAPRRKAVYQMQ
jgi:hypothetical protein